MAPKQTLLDAMRGRKRKAEDEARERLRKAMEEEQRLRDEQKRRTEERRKEMKAFLKAIGGRSALRRYRRALAHGDVTE